MRVRILVVAIFLLGLGAQAQAPLPRPWPQEPESFLGIKFGQPLRQSVVICPGVTEYGHTRYDWPEFGHPCFEPIAGFYEIYNEPLFFNIFAEEVRGTVEKLSMSFKSEKANEIADALIEKYGKPQQQGTTQLHNGYGATFDDQVLIWQGINVEIDFDSVGSEAGRGTVQVYTAVYLAHLQKEKDNQKDSLKGVL